jgi:hypothetical protein
VDSVGEQRGTSGLHEAWTCISVSKGKNVNKRWIVLAASGEPDGKWSFTGTANAETWAGAVADVGLRHGRSFDEWSTLVAFCPDDLRRSVVT